MNPMSCIISMIEVRNAYVICDTLWTDNDYAKKELAGLVKTNGGANGKRLYIEFENYEVESLESCIKIFRANLEPHLISRNLYNIQEKSLAKIASDFVESAMNFGLSKIYPADNILRKSTFDKCIPTLKINRSKSDQKICDRYLPAIKLARDLYSNPKILKNIEELVNRIYIDPSHKLKHSFFDSEGKRLSQLYHSTHDWYKMYYSGTNLMVAIGAFGFEDPKAILFLAFDRIRHHLNDLEERRDWRHIDNMLPQLIKDKLDLIHLFSWMKEKKLLDSFQLIQAAPLANIIPGDGLHLFTDSFDEYTKFELDNFYPHLKYELID